MDLRQLPALNALRAFEAAARHESFSRAADELFVTIVVAAGANPEVSGRKNGRENQDYGKKGKKPNRPHEVEPPDV